MNTETAVDGTVTFKVVDNVVSSALLQRCNLRCHSDHHGYVIDVGCYRRTGHLRRRFNLDYHSSDGSANFADVTDVSVVTVIAAAKESAEDAVEAVATAVVAADATELADYASGASASTIASAVTTASADVVETVAAAVVESDSSSAAEAAALTNTGYSLPESISVLETVE